MHHRATLGRRWWAARDGVPATHPARAAIEVATTSRRRGRAWWLRAACCTASSRRSPSCTTRRRRREHWPGQPRHQARPGPRRRPPRPTSPRRVRGTCSSSSGSPARAAGRGVRRARQPARDRRLPVARSSGSSSSSTAGSSTSSTADPASRSATTSCARSGARSRSACRRAGSASASPGPTSSARPCLPAGSAGAREPRERALTAHLLASPTPGGGCTPLQVPDSPLERGLATGPLRHPEVRQRQSRARRTGAPGPASSSAATGRP